VHLLFRQNICAQRGKRHGAGAFQDFSSVHVASSRPKNPAETVRRYVIGYIFTTDEAIAPRIA
jgi:hypothetical protein